MSERLLRRFVAGVLTEAFGHIDGDATADSDLKHIMLERLKKSDANHVATTLQNVAGKMNVRVVTSIDDSQKMLNVFVRLVHGDQQATEEALVDAAHKVGWTLLSKRGLVWWFEPKPETKGAVSATKLPSTMYHTTISTNVQHILEKGLEPRTRQFNNTSRRYSPRVKPARRRRSIG